MKRPINAAILEDEALARRRLERLVATQPDLTLVGSYDNPLNARAALENVHLLFLDVEMPFENGFTFLNALPERLKPYVIFTTAHERHAVKAFRHDAVDFLLKPYDEPTFAQAVDRARRRIHADALRDSQVLGRAASPPSTFLGVRVVDGDAELVLAPGRIDWIRVEGGRIGLCAEGRTFRAAGTLADYEERLRAHRFFRIHRSTLVNLERIKAVRSLSHGDRVVILADGQELALSRHYAAEFDALTL